MFKPSITTGPKNGHIATISNGSDTYHIHPLAEMKDREFFSLSAAEALAAGHAVHVNRNPDLLRAPSFVKVA